MPTDPKDREAVHQDIVQEFVIHSDAEIGAADQKYLAKLIHAALAEARADQKERDARVAELPIGDLANPAWQPRTPTEIATAIRSQDHD